MRLMPLIVRPGKPFDDASRCFFDVCSRVALRRFIIGSKIARMTPI